jgi:Fe-S-cluster containining protein
MEETPSHFESVHAFKEFRRRLDGILAEAWLKYQDKMQCKAGCFSCCKNNFHISPVESQGVLEAVQLLSAEVKSKIRKNLSQPERLLCPLLVEDRCSIYESRPILCRIFGFPVSDGSTMATCELNFMENRESLHTLQCFDSVILGQTLQTISRLFLQELGHPLKEEEAIPMIRIDELLSQSSQAL